jgi:proteasome alpha subunit
MTMPFYVPAEQMMKDKADFARKNIARGKALVALLYSDGILIAAENTSATLRKVAEIYDRIAFAGAGKYNEYDRLRIAGVRHADTKGYLYSREDVDAQSLANAYAQMLGDIFTHEIKPMEVEIVVAELGDGQSGDRLFHIFYDGTVVDEEGFSVLGGSEVEAVTERVKQSYEPGRSLDEALRAAVSALAGPERSLAAAELEVAVLSRGNGRRAFHRLSDDDVAAILEGGEAAAPAEPAPAEAPSEPAPADETATPTPEASAPEGEAPEGDPPEGQAPEGEAPAGGEPEAPTDG